MSSLTFDTESLTERSSFKIDIFDGTDFKYWSQKMFLIFKLKGWTSVIAANSEKPSILEDDREVAKDELVGMNSKSPAWSSGTSSIGDVIPGSLRSTQAHKAAKELVTALAEPRLEADQAQPAQDCHLCSEDRRHWW
jgi:hypothetical protein